MSVVGLMASIIIPAFLRARQQAKQLQATRTEIAQNSTNAYEVAFLFEKDGLKVYRFFDPYVTFGHPIYFVDGRGSTSQGSNEKNTKQDRVVTY